jgi:hypothetical protein
LYLIYLRKAIFGLAELRDGAIEDRDITKLEIIN